MYQNTFCPKCKTIYQLSNLIYKEHKYSINEYGMCFNCYLINAPVIKISEGISLEDNDNSNIDEHKVFETGAKRDRPSGKGRYDLLSPVAMRRIAQRSEFGEMKYGDGRNWEKGMPISEFMDSALRHIFQYMDGDIQEDHLAAAAWNLNCAMHLEEKMPHMQNIPSRQKTLQSKEEEID